MADKDWRKGVSQKPVQRKIGLRRVRKVSGELAQRPDDALQSIGVYAVLGFFEAEHAAIRWVIFECDQRQHAQCAIQKHVQGEAAPIFHPRLHHKLIAFVILLDRNTHKTGHKNWRDRAKCRARWLHRRLQAGQGCRQVAADGSSGLYFSPFYCPNFWLHHICSSFPFLFSWLPEKTYIARSRPLGTLGFLKLYRLSWLKHRYIFDV